MCCLFKNSMKWQYDHCRSRINTKRDNEKAKADSLSSENKVEDKVKVLADDEGNDGLEMVGDDGIVSDLPLTDLAENGNGHIGDLVEPPVDHFAPPTSQCSLKYNIFNTLKMST